LGHRLAAIGLRPHTEVRRQVAPLLSARRRLLVVGAVKRVLRQELIEKFYYETKEYLLVDSAIDAEDLNNVRQ
jgi:hypothetical protein